MVTDIQEVVVLVTPIGGLVSSTGSGGRAIITDLGA